MANKASKFKWKNSNLPNSNMVFYEHKKNYGGKETQIHNYYLLIYEI